MGLARAYLIAPGHMFYGVQRFQGERWCKLTRRDNEDDMAMYVDRFAWWVCIE